MLSVVSVVTNVVAKASLSIKSRAKDIPGTLRVYIYIIYEKITLHLHLHIDVNSEPACMCSQTRNTVTVRRQSAAVI